jgi:hypothetical protein
MYSGVAKRFSLVEPPCNELETPAESVTPQVRAAIRGWLREMDGRIQVHHLRLFLQTSPLSNEGNVRSLIRHHFNKESRSAADRDKLDFLLVQYFSQSAPTQVLLNARPAFADVAKVLEPVLGMAPSQLPPRLQPLEEMLNRLSYCANLRDLLQRGVLNEVRQLKDSAEGVGFEIPELVAFARANFLIRQTFFRLIHADLDTIRFSARRLEKHGVKTIDCTRAQLASAEPVARVLELAQQWKKPFQADYSAGNPFAQLAELRAAMEEALVKHGLSNGAVPDSFVPITETRPPAKEIPVPRAIGSAQPQAPSSEPKASLSVPVPDVPVSAKPSAAESTQPVSRPDNAEVSASPASAPDIENAQSPAEDKEPSASTPSPPSSVAAAVSAPNPTATDQNGLSAKLQTVLEQLSSYLLADRVRSRTMGATIVIGSARLVISSWEVTGFLDPGRQFSKNIQRAVAVRVLLFQGLEQVRQGASPRKLAPIVTLVRNEAADLQQVVNTARQAHDIEATVALSAASQQLTSMLREAEPFMRVL